MSKPSSSGFELYTQVRQQLVNSLRIEHDLG